MFDPLHKAPRSLNHTLASYYLTDSRDFASRFDRLWEVETHKTGRIKTFVDLLMGCECALKSHIFLGRLKDDPKAVYRSMMDARHRIGQLADQATFLSDGKIYEALKQELDALSVALRYSLDAYETFFPSYVDRSAAAINYSATIGNQAWVLTIRGFLNELVQTAGQTLGGEVDIDIVEILAVEKEMQDFWSR